MSSSRRSRVDRATAESLTSADFVRRSVAKPVRMKDIEAVTGTRGYHGLWRIIRPAGTQRVIVVSRWFWEVEPGGEALSVEEEEDGIAGQPIIVPMR